MPSEPNQAAVSPLWSKALSVFLGSACVLILVLWLAASFTSKPKADGRPAVVDQAGVFGKSAIDELKSIRFPDDTPVIVRTVGKIPLRAIGSYATESMNQDPQWQALRPRGFLRRYFRRDSPNATGVYVLVSLDPLLLQLRFGGELRLRAYRAGLGAGPWYREQQRFAQAETEAHTVQTVQRLAQALRRVGKPSRLMGLLEHIPAEAYAEVEDFLVPSDGRFSGMVLTKYVEVLAHLGGTQSTWRFVLVNVFCILLPWFVVKTVLIEVMLAKRISNRFVIGALKTVTNFGLAGLVLTSVAALGLLSHGRIEDEMALSGLGLGFLGQIGFDPGMYARAGGYLIAIPVAILKFLIDFVETARQSGNTGRTEINLGCLVWAGVLFVLPLAIGFFAVPMLVWQLGKAFFKSQPEAASTAASAGSFD